MTATTSPGSGTEPTRRAGELVQAHGYPQGRGPRGEGERERVSYLEDLHQKLTSGKGFKLLGTFSGQKAFEEAGGEWEPDALQWVDYYDQDDREDPTCLFPWCDMTLMLYSREVGDMRPATEEDLRRIGFVREEDIR